MELCLMVWQYSNAVNLFSSQKHEIYNLVVQHCTIFQNDLTVSNDIQRFPTT